MMMMKKKQKICKIEIKETERAFDMKWRESLAASEMVEASFVIRGIH